MFLSPSSTARVEFQVDKSGELVNLTSPSAVIFRNGILTSIQPAITNPATGIYYAAFAVPDNWQDHDSITCQFSGVVSGKAIACLKPVGIVLRLNSKVDLLYQFRGLDPANPWLITDGGQSAGNATLTQTDDGMTTTVQRQP